MAPHFLLTGGTGFIGSSLVPRILQSIPGSTITLLVRASDDKDAALRAAAVAERAGSGWGIPDASSRVSGLPGDLGFDWCGLSSGGLAELTSKTTHIIHGAAAIRFDLALEAARGINCDGTRRMLNIAERCFREGVLERFVYLGTSSVSGRRAGPILEDELEAGQMFFNTYEQTKCEAERIVRDHFDRIPCTVFRPSIVIGDSHTGWTSAFNVVYIPLRLLHKGMLHWIPGTPETTLDLVPVDWVSDATIAIMTRPESAGQVFHLTAGPGRAARLGEVVRLAIDYFDRRSPLDTLRRIEFLHVQEFTRRRSLTRGREAAMFSQLDALLPYLGVERQFDSRNADALLSSSMVRFPRFEEYAEKIFGYCIDSAWGKRTPQGGAGA